MGGGIQVQLALALLAAGGAAAVLVALFSSRRNASAAWRARGWVLGLGAGGYLGWLVLGILPGWPPLDVRDRFLMLVYPALLLADLLTADSALSPQRRWLTRGSVAAAAAPTLLFGSVYLSDMSGPDTREWSTGTALLVLGTLGAILAGTWAILDRNGEGGSAVAVSSLVLSLLGACGMIMLSGSATVGLLGLPLAAATTAALVGTLTNPEAGCRTGPPGAPLGGLFALVVIGRFFAELSTIHALLLFVAPVLGTLLDCLAGRRLNRRLRAGGCLLVVGSLMAGVLASAHARFRQAQPELGVTAESTLQRSEPRGPADLALPAPEPVARPPSFDEPVSPP
jgi:hypothetical protein